MTHKDFAISLARKAGGIIRENFLLGMKKEWKADNTPLTATDLRINQMAIDEINREFPGHSVLAEEGSALVENAEYTWVCDPVDGTIPFSHGLPLSTFGLALVKDGQPILGVVYDPFMDRMYFAEKGKGAYLNDKLIHVSTANVLKNTVCGFEGSSSSKYTAVPVMVELFKEGAKPFKIYSFMYVSMMVACGEFVGSYYPWDKAHDGATVKIIVEEAGGKVTDIDGNEQRYDQPIKGCLASNGILHDKFLEVIRRAQQTVK